MLLTLSSILILSFVLYKWPFSNLKNVSIYAIVCVFLLKSIAGFLSFTYHNYYFAGGDSAIYLQGGKDLIHFSNGNVLLYLKLFLNLNRGIPEWDSIYSQIIYWDSKAPFNIINDNRNAIRVNSLVSLVSFKNTQIHIVVLNFLSIVGLISLYKSFSYFFKNIPSLVIFTAVFLSPSILFWTSGILKETHTILIVGLFFLALSNWLRSKQLKYLLYLIVLASLLILVRSYFSLFVLLATFLLLLLNRIRFYKRSKKIVILLSLGFTSLLLLSFLPISLFEIIKEKQNAFILIGSKANSFFTIKPIQEPKDVLLLFPISIINVLIQPQLFSIDSWLYLFPIIENIDILFFCFVAIRYYNPPTFENKNYMIMVIFIYLLSSWLIGLTVPIQGAIARYKALSQPFLLIFIFSNINWKKIKGIYFPVKKLS